MKRYEKHGRNPSSIVKRFGKCRRKVGWIVRYGKYERKLWNDMENMEERQVEMWKDMVNMEERQVVKWKNMKNMEEE